MEMGMWIHRLCLGCVLESFKINGRQQKLLGHVHFVTGGNLPENSVLSYSHLIKIIYSISVFRGMSLDPVPDSPQRSTVCWEKTAFMFCFSATYPVMFFMVMFKKISSRAVSRDKWGSWYQSPILLICPVARLSSSISSQRQKHTVCSRDQSAIWNAIIKQSWSDYSLLPATAEIERLCFCLFLMTAALARTLSREEASRQQRKGKESSVLM